MDSLRGKRLLLLGSNLWKENIKQFAVENGVYLVFAGLYPGPLDEIADEYYRIDTTDSTVMIPFIKAHRIDGVFMGGSELIISKSCDYINRLGFPCYCTKEQWDILQNKRAFKDACNRFKVPTVPEFDIHQDLQIKDYPVIVKPIDGCGSRGISVCRNDEELKEAKQRALQMSPSQKVLIERYIDNGGLTCVVNYVAINGNYYLDAMGDRYVLNGGLITAGAFFPSKYLDLWLKEADPFIRDLMKALGIMNGAISFQALPEGDKIYVYECCFRLTGGMTYKMTDVVSRHNSFKLLLSYSLTGEMGDDEASSRIDPTFRGQKGMSMTIPLRIGKIGRVEGVEEIKSLKQVVDYTQYYKVGDSIVANYINTLDQLFARIMVVGDSLDSLVGIMSRIRESLKVEDECGENMVIWDTFDKLYEEFKVK